jgi:hypothetical protein
MAWADGFEQSGTAVEGLAASARRAVSDRERRSRGVGDHVLARERSCICPRKTRRRAVARAVTPVAGQQIAQSRSCSRGTRLHASVTPFGIAEPNCAASRKPTALV